MTCDITLALSLGHKVERAADTLPQSTQAPLFTVSGGRVLVTGLVGEITVDIQDGVGAVASVVESNPTTGTDSALIPTFNLGGQPAGQLVGVDQAGASLVASAVALVDPIVVQAGTIDLSCGASATGEIAWTLLYIPLDDGASVAAA